MSAPPTPTPTPREVIARAACRSRCQGRVHICDQGDYGACLPDKCFLWDALWEGDADAILAALRAAPPETRLALIRDVMPETHAVEVRGVMETLHNGMNCIIHEEDNDPPDVENAVRIARATLDEVHAMLAASQPDAALARDFQRWTEGSSDGE